MHKINNVPYVTRYDKTYHSQTNIIFQYRASKSIQEYFFNFCIFAYYENMIFSTLAHKISQLYKVV